MYGNFLIFKYFLKLFNRYETQIAERFIIKHYISLEMFSVIFTEENRSFSY